MTEPPTKRQKRPDSAAMWDASDRPSHDRKGGSGATGHDSTRKESTKDRNRQRDRSGDRQPKRRDKHQDQDRPRRRSRDRDGDREGKGKHRNGGGGRERSRSRDRGRVKRESPPRRRSHSRSRSRSPRRAQPPPPAKSRARSGSGSPPRSPQERRPAKAGTTSHNSLHDKPGHGRGKEPDKTKSSSVKKGKKIPEDQRSSSPPTAMDVDSEKPGSTATADGAPKAKSKKGSASVANGDNDDGDPEAARMRALMGFSGFKTTKQTKVPGNNVYGVRKEKKTEYRQYMNRVGGFNRPLSPSR